MRGGLLAPPQPPPPPPLSPQVPPDRCSLFDPVFSAQEAAALGELGLRLLPDNEVRTGEAAGDGDRGAGPHSLPCCRLAWPREVGGSYRLASATGAR